MTNRKISFQTTYDKNLKLTTYSIVPYDVEAHFFKKSDFENNIKQYDFLKDKEALYFLFGDVKYYIGETGDALKRIKQHKKERDFWDKAFVITSRHLNQTTRRFFERQLLNEEGLVDFGGLISGNISKGNDDSKSFDEYSKNLHNNFREVIVNFFKLIEGFFPSESILSDEEIIETIPKEIFIHKGTQKIFHGKLEVTNDQKFVLKEGSIIAGEQTEYIKASRIYEKIKTIISDRELTSPNDDGSYTLLKDLPPEKYPTVPSDITSGNSDNGWTTFKNSKGQTLDEVYRRSDSFEVKRERWKESDKLISHLEDKISESFKNKFSTKQTVHYMAISDLEGTKLFYIRIFKNLIRLYTNSEHLSNVCGFERLDKIHWGDSNWMLTIRNESDIDTLIPLLKKYENEVKEQNNEQD